MGSQAGAAFVAGIDRQVSTSRTSGRGGDLLCRACRVTFDHVMVLMGTWAALSRPRSTPVVAFSWPTGTSVWHYLVDCPAPHPSRTSRGWSSADRRPQPGSPHQI